MDDFEKWLEAHGQPRIGHGDDCLRAAYEAGQASKGPSSWPWADQRIAELEARLSAAQKVIEAAEELERVANLALGDRHGYPTLWADYVRDTCRTALSEYQAVTKDDLTPSSPTGSALQGGE